MKCKLLILSILLANFAFSQTKYSRISIPDYKATLSDLAKIGIVPDHSLSEEDGQITLLVNEHELNTLDNSGIDYEVIQTDYSSYLQKKRKQIDLNRSVESCSSLLEQFGYKMPTGYSHGSMGGYHTYQQMLETIDDLASSNSNFVKPKKKIGNFTTYEGRSIFYYTLSDYRYNSSTKKKILITGLHHAREPISMEQVLYFTNFMLENKNDEQIAYLLKNTEFYFVPCINPDGYVYNESIAPNGGGLHRKNRNPSSGGATIGVDLNRNYGQFWGIDNFGSSNEPSSEAYRGTAPFSEPETRAIKKLCTDNQFLMALNYHGYGDVLIVPWSYSEFENTPEDKKYRALATEIAHESKLKIGKGVETLGYTANGDSDDWMYGDQNAKNKIWAFTPEMGNSYDDFWPAKSRIIPICQEASLMNLKAALSLFNEIRREYITPTVIEQKSFTETVRMYNVGIQEGSALVSFRAVSDNIRQLPSSAFVDVTNDVSADFAFDFSLSSSVQPGDEILIEVIFDNNVESRDTIRKLYLPTASKVDLFDNYFSTVNRGARLSSWSFVDYDCYSAPDCFTDSQFGNYSSNSSTDFTLDGPIYLPNQYDLLELSFVLKWEVSRTFRSLDYAQVMISTDGANFTPLCTEHTIPSTHPTNIGEPVYMGTQDQWILEEIDLSDYAGKNIWIKFVLNSFNGEPSDGIYIDDLYLIMEQNVSTSEVIKFSEVATIFPNPVSKELSLEVNPELLKSVQGGQIISAEGKLVKSVSDDQFTTAMTIPVDDLSSGLYMLKIQLKSGEYTSQKFIITK